MLRAEGRTEGRLEGEIEPRRRSLLDQVELKFGSISADAHIRIESATNEQLARWLRRIILAPAVGDVFDA
jgi:hypothetical protein